MQLGPHQGSATCTLDVHRGDVARATPGVCHMHVRRVEAMQLGPHQGSATCTKEWRGDMGGNRTNDLRIRQDPMLYHWATMPSWEIWSKVWSYIFCLQNYVFCNGIWLVKNHSSPKIFLITKKSSLYPPTWGKTFQFGQDLNLHPLDVKNKCFITEPLWLLENMYKIGWVIR